jgi:PAS domain-containing protein
MLEGEKSGNPQLMDYNHYDFTSEGIEQGFQLIGTDWRYRYVNAEAIRQYGFSGENDLLGFSLAEKFPGIESSTMYRQLEMAMYESIASILEYEIVSPLGLSGWYELRVYPLLSGIMVLSIDITERKKQKGNFS